jgi:SH3-like domain-containing protein
MPPQSGLTGRTTMMRADSGLTLPGARPARSFSLAALLVCLATSLLLGAASASAQKMVSVSADNTNWRSGPGARFPVRWVLERGYPLAVIGTRGSWLHVRDFERDEGWIARQVTTDTPHFVVKVKDALMRQRPSTGSRVLARLVYGEVVKRLESNADWVKVRLRSGKRGWVAKRLLWGW